MTTAEHRLPPSPSPAVPQSPRYRAFRGGDIRESAIYFLSALAVRALPESAWPSVAENFARFSSRKSARYEKFRGAVRAVLGNAIGETELPGIYASLLRHGHRRRLYIAATCRRQGWTPSIELTGRERLDRAHAGGRGAILWFDNFAHFAVIGKRAFAESGYPLWHLGSHLHGFSATRYATRFLNPRQIAVEGRYLAGRIMFDNRTLITATRRVVEILAGNGLMAITNNANLGKSARFPFGEAARLSIATTPLRLAAGRGVPLLPVSVIEVEPFRRYRVAIGPEIAAPAGMAEREAIAAMAAAYIDYLLPIVRAHPDQWGGWGPLGNAIAAPQARGDLATAPPDRAAGTAG
jgi:lauroyl/myristoyl acyltransferase